MFGIAARLATSFTSFTSGHVSSSLTLMMRVRRVQWARRSANPTVAWISGVKDEVCLRDIRFGRFAAGVLYCWRGLSLAMK